MRSLGYISLFCRLRPQPFPPRQSRRQPSQYPLPIDPFNPTVRVKIQPAHEHCFSYEEILEKVIPVMKLIGPRLHHDMYFVTKLMRLIRSAPAESIDQWNYLFMTYVLPALSLSDANIGLCHEVWSWLRDMPYQER